VLLDRALLHYDLVARRTHARRGPPAPGEDARAGLVAGFARDDRRALDDLFRRLRRDPHDPPRAVRDAVERAIARILERIDPVPERETAGGE
jgi:hypothetical protein